MSLLLRIVWRDICSSCPFAGQFKGKTENETTELLLSQVSPFIEMLRLLKLDESLVPFVEEFEKAIELTLPRHRELAAKLLESFTVHFCEMGHSPYIVQAVLKGFP
jgi:hypothetical protein